MKEMKAIAKKLVLATGTTSNPHMPSIPGMDTFKGPLFHTADLGCHAEDLIAAKNIVVLGGSKSSADAVYINASQGKHVDWVIRGRSEIGRFFLFLFSQRN
jgi:cation diffusion facilitator CzcD-associated flavoprotein CzcO